MLTHDLTEMTETIGLKRCCACTAELRERDKFCRRCGVRQDQRYVTSTDLAHLATNETRPLQRCTENCSTYSGQLIRIIADSVSSRTTAQTTQGWLKRLICSLIAIPIWMLIVMLSPLDAYAAAKAAAGCVNCR